MIRIRRLKLPHNFRIWWKRFDRKFPLTKRQVFVVVTGVLTVGLVLTQLVDPDARYPMVIILFIIAYLLSAFSLRDDLKGIEWFTLLILPSSYTAAVALFYFLLPVRWLTRIPVATAYAIGMYAILLTENIYNVAVEHSIALLRAAHTIGFLITLVTYYFLVQTVVSMRFVLPLYAVCIALMSMVLITQILWAIELTSQISHRVKVFSLVLTTVLVEFAWVMYFWPVPLQFKSLFLTTIFYSIVGMTQQYMVDRLYKKTVIEFGSVSVVVFILMIFTTNWRMLN